MLYLYCYLFTIFLNFEHINSCFYTQIIFAFITYLLIKHVLLPIYNIELASGIDTYIQQDDPGNNSHMVFTAIIHKVADISAIITQIKTEFKRCHQSGKLTKTLKTRFFISYWTQNLNFSLDNHIEILKQPIETYRQLNNFMTLHTSELDFAKRQPRWKIFLIPSFSNKTVIILKIHHSYGDNASLLSFILNLGGSDTYQMIKLPKISNIRWFFLLPFGLLHTFLLLIYVMFYKLWMKKNLNKFRTNKLSGVKTGYCSKAFSIESLRVYSKTMGALFNEFVLAVYNKALQNYHQKKFKEELTELPLILGASLRGAPEPNEPLKLTNYQSFIRVDEFPTGSFSEILKKYHSIIYNFKKCYDFYYYRFFIEVLFVIFPNFIAFWFVSRLFKAYPFLFTCLPGPQKEITLFNQKVEELMFLTSSPPTSGISVIFNVLSYNGKVNFGCFSDNASNIEAEEFIEEIGKVIASEMRKML